MTALHRPGVLLVAGLAAVLVGVGPVVPGGQAAVFLETFGGVECAECPAVRDVVTQLEGEFGSALVAVEYHSAGALVSSEAAQRAAYYGETTLPTSHFNGGNPYVGGAGALDAYRSLVGLHASVTPPATIEPLVVFVSSSFAGFLDAEIEIDPAGSGIPNPQDYSLRALFYEDNVIRCCGPAGQDRWSRVVRRVLPDRPLRGGAPGATQSERWVGNLDAGWDANRLRAVVWLQNDADLSVAAAARAVDGGGLQPLPLSGLDETRVNLLPCQPNPVRGVEARLLFTLPRAGHAKMQILNANGRVVRVLTDGPRPPGIHDVRWDGTDYTGRRMAAGVYIYRLETFAGVAARKLTLIR